MRDVACLKAGLKASLPAGKDMGIAIIRRIWYFDKKNGP
jgi:hypothetical protein